MRRPRSFQCLILSSSASVLHLFFFFFNDTATTEIYTLSLHDALPICPKGCLRPCCGASCGARRPDRKSTRLNSSHVEISYAVFCLKKKKQKNKDNNIKKQKKVNQQNAKEQLKK